MSMKVACLLTVAVIVTGCRSMQRPVANAIEPCNGRVLGPEFVALRDAALHELLTELTPGAGQMVVTRTAVVRHPLLISQPDLVVKAAGSPLGEALLDKNSEAACWPQGDFSLQIPSDSDRATQDDWKAFRSANPAVIGILSVGKPVILRKSSNEEVAAMLVDFRCGDMCGGLWLAAFRRDASRWTRVSLRGLLNY